MHPPIPLLERLREFDDSVDDFYASGFELLPSGEDDGGYPRLSDSVRPFAQANGSGSTYAIWLRDDRADLASLPVLFLGDEGGVHVVARDLPELLRVVAAGWSPTGEWDSLDYYDEREEDDGWDPCPANPAFRVWLREHLGLDAAEDPNEIVRAAGAELWEPFAAWIGPLIPDVISSRRSA